MVRTLKERCKTLAEMVEYGDFYFKEDLEYEEKGVRKYLLKDRERTLKVFGLFLERLKGIGDLRIENIESIFKEIATDVGIKLVDMAQAVRVVLTGRTVSPGIYEIIEVLGKERVIRRVLRGMEFIKNSQ